MLHFAHIFLSLFDIWNHLVESRREEKHNEVTSMKSYDSKNGDVSKKMHLHAYKRTHNAHKSIKVNHNVGQNFDFEKFS
ncbi:hypothetical protein PFBG_01244 [Plasmodium falciparum 7G8]|uniref:Uncharacterized protein n=1 Tax=Plasmodium falciparum (isolate 7G8) TaxID=57266 RepID=W7F5B5_PLAF8|nr:hypothetical protein PFBG_01244 [Plasmodium falciparum 7G8]